MSDSIFTNIIERKIPADIVYEDESVVAFHDNAPQAPVHLLIVPRKRIPTINDVEPEDETLLGHMVLVARRLAEQFHLDLGYRLVMNCDRHGGQTVFHLHMHVLGGRVMGWPPG